MSYLKSYAEKQGTPLLLFSENEFKKSYNDLKSFLPNVKHHYALKPLPLQSCVEAIAQCDGYFDIASLGELNLIKEFNPNLLAKTIYTHPIKKISEIETLIQHGVKTMIVDSLEEMNKFIPFRSKAQLLIRIAFPNEFALCNLSEKFGADESLYKKMVAFAVENKLNVKGCSFHVGSQMANPEQHVNAIKRCRVLYNWAEKTYGLKFSILDIGGGFPAQYGLENMTMENFCKPIAKILKLGFPNIEVWSEPGRCIAANSLIAISQVVGKTIKNGKTCYFLDDGVYGTYSGIIYEKLNYDLYPVNPSGENLLPSSFLGPTCDSIDVIAKDILFQPLNIGDYVYSKRIGAYSWASRTRFNLIQEPKIVAFNFDLDALDQKSISQVQS